MKMEIVFKDGRKETFDSVASFNVTEEQTAKKECNSFMIASIPVEGMLFEVNPLEIDRRKFEKPRSDPRQEVTRLIIMEAFTEVDKYPEKYASPFYTLIPEKNWNGSKTVEELRTYANDLGGLVANWIEQAMEWAQQISKGKSWEAICNKPDNSKWLRIIVWKNGYFRLVGSSRNFFGGNPASLVNFSDYDSYDRVDETVPLVVLKKK